MCFPCRLVEDTVDDKCFRLLGITLLPLPPDKHTKSNVRNGNAARQLTYSPQLVLERFRADRPARRVHCSEATKPLPCHIRKCISLVEDASILHSI